MFGRIEWDLDTSIHDLSQTMFGQSIDYYNQDYVLYIYIYIYDGSKGKTFLANEVNYWMAFLSLTSMNI